MIIAQKYNMLLIAKFRDRVYFSYTTTYINTKKGLTQIN